MYNIDCSPEEQDDLYWKSRINGSSSLNSAYNIMSEWVLNHQTSLTFGFLLLVKEQILCMTILKNNNSKQNLRKKGTTMIDTDTGEIRYL